MATTPPPLLSDLVVANIAASMSMSMTPPIKSLWWSAPPLPVSLSIFLLVGSMCVDADDGDEVEEGGLVWVRLGF